MVLFCLHAHSKFDSESDFYCDAYSAIAVPETPISLRSSP